MLNAYIVNMILISVTVACTLSAMVVGCFGVPAQSPCPAVLRYDTTIVLADRWYATVRLKSDVNLTGFSLDIGLNRKAYLLGNDVSNASSSDNKVFTVQNLKKTISPGNPTDVRFFVKYNEAEVVPEVDLIRLNGREICSVGGSTSAYPAPIPNTPRSALNPGTATVFTTSGLEYDDYFSGDLSDAWTSLIQTKSEFACGVVPTQPVPLITRGQPTQRGQWPWHIALYQARGIDLIYICGGSVLSKTAVLTAAHCVTRLSTNTAIDPETLLVALGKYNLKYSYSGEQSQWVSSIIVHPSFNHSNLSHDIAILKFKDPVTFDSVVQPICLWDQNEIDISSVIGELGTVVGWGIDETRKTKEELSKALMPVVEESVCIRSNVEFFPQFISADTYCAGFMNGTGPCNGDSGGGMVFFDKEKRVWKLRGLVSLSMPLHGQNVCNTNHYTVFTDAAQFLPWIRENMT